MMAVAMATPDLRATALMARTYGFTSESPLNRRLSTPQWPRTCRPGPLVINGPGTPLYVVGPTPYVVRRCPFYAVRRTRCGVRCVTTYDVRRSTPLNTTTTRPS